LMYNLLDCPKYFSQSSARRNDIGSQELRLDLRLQWSLK
jgi:hypothetical protein